MQINEWLLTPRWDKAVLVELILLALLIVTNFLLYLGAVRRSSTELLAWLVSHSIFFVIQILLVVYFIVVIFIIASPHSQVKAYYDFSMFRKFLLFYSMYIGPGMTHCQ